MKLLIIGNGFDKYCSLNSSFKDYFNNEYSNIGDGYFFSNIYNVNVGDVLNYYSSDFKDSHNLTFIEKYIMYYKNSNNLSTLHWSDIEGIIIELLKSDGLLEKLMNKC